MDTSLLRTVYLVPEMPKIITYIPYLYNTDTSVKRTLGSVPLVSVLKRFDSNIEDDHHFTWSPKPCECHIGCLQGKGRTFISQLFQDLEYWSALGIETCELPQKFCATRYTS